MLGYLSPSRFAGGTLPLSTELATAAVTRGIAGPLGLAPIDAAAAIFELVTADMAAAVRMVTIERGLDPREFVLVSFGGSGPVHAAGIAATFGIEKVLVPAHAGVRSAVGLLGSDLSTDQVQSCLQSLDDGDPGQVALTFDELERRARRDLDLPERPPAGAGHRAGEPVYTRLADVRFRGQAHHLMVPVPDGPIRRETIDEIIHAFVVRYKEVYGISTTGPTELVNCRLRAVLAVPKWTLADFDPTPLRRRRPRPNGRRAAWFDASGGLVPVSAYEWDDLDPGDHIDGPAVVDGSDATLLVPPGADAALDQWGNLVVTTTTGKKSRSGRGARR